jgi:hypothetical protein
MPGGLGIGGPGGGVFPEGGDVTSADEAAHAGRTENARHSANDAARQP